MVSALLKVFITLGYSRRRSVTASQVGQKRSLSPRPRQFGELGVAEEEGKGCSYDQMESVTEH